MQSEEDFKKAIENSPTAWVKDSSGNITELTGREVRESGLDKFISATDPVSIYKSDTGWTTNPYQASASISLDKDTGEITIKAPKVVLDDPAFNEIFNKDTLKQFSSAYQRNPEFKVPDLFDESDEKKDVSIPEIVEKYNDQLKDFVKALDDENQYRNKIATGKSGYSNRNDIANRLTRDDFIIMSNNATGEGANDKSLISIPKSMYADVIFLESFDAEKGTVEKGEFRDRVFSINKKGDEYVKSLYSRIEEYFEDDDFADTEEYARMTALNDFILNNDPDADFFNTTRLVFTGLMSGAGLNARETLFGLVNLVSAIGVSTGGVAGMALGQATKGAVGEWAAENMESARKEFKETNKLLGQLSTAGKTAMNVSKVGEELAEILIPSSIAGKAAKVATKASLAAREAATVAREAEVLTVGADAVVAASSATEAAEIGKAAVTLSRKARFLSEAADLAAQTITEAVISDPVVFSKILQNQETEGVEAGTEQDVYGYLLETAAWNIGGWGAFSVAAKGVKSFGKTSAGRYTNAVAQKYLNKVSVSTGRVGEKILKARYGENYLNGSSNVNKNQARKYNYELRQAQELVAKQKIGAPFSKQAAENVKQQEMNVIKLMKLHNATDAVQRGSKAYIRRMLDSNVNPTLAGYEQKLRALGSDITKLERRAGLSTRRKVFRTKDGAVDRVFSKESANYIGARTQLDILENIKRIRGGLTDAQKKSKEILEKKLADAKEKLSQEIQGKLENYLDWDRKFYAEYNNLRMREGSLNSKQIKELRDEGYWGENGELYRPSYRVDPDRETKLVRNDGRVARDNDTATEQFVWGSDKDFMDPEIGRYMTMGDAGSTLNATRYIEAVSAIPSTKAHVVYDAEEVARAQRMKDIRKPLVARIENVTKGVFASGAISTGESAKRASRLYKMRANWVKSVGEVEGSGLSFARVSRKKISLTVTEKRTAIGAMDSSQIDNVLSEAGVTFNFQKMNSPEEFEAFYNSLDKTTQKYVQQKMGNVAGILYPSETNRLDRAVQQYRRRRLDVFDEIPASVEHQRMVNKIENGQTVAFVYMTPDEYMEALVKENGGGYNNIEEVYAKANEKTSTGKTWRDYYSDMNNKNFDPNAGEGKFPPPSITYRGSGYDTQEGVHRAYAAKQLGVQRMPVSVEYPAESQLSEVESLLQGKDIVRIEDSVPLVRNAPYITAENYNKLAQMDPSFVLGLKKNLVQNRPDLRDSNIVTKATEDAKRAKLAAERKGIYKENLAKLKKLTKKGLDAKDEDAILLEFDEGISEYLNEVYSDKKLSQSIDDIIEQSGTVDKEAAREYIVLEEMLRNKKQAFGEIKQIAKDEFKGESEKGKISDMFEQMFEDEVFVRRNAARQKLADEGSSLVDRKSWMEEIRKLDKDITGDLAKPGYVSIPNAKGEMEVWEVDPVAADLYEYAARQPDMGKIAKFFNETSKIFRLGTTGLNLMSFVNQSFRDFGNLWLTSGSYHMINLSRAEMEHLLGPEIANWYLREEPEIYNQLLKQAERQGKSIESMVIERELAIGRQTSTQATETAFLKTVGDAKELNRITKGETSVSNDFIDRIVDKLSTPNEWRERYLRNIVYADSLNQALKRGYTLKDARIQAEFMMNNATTNFSRQLVHLQSWQKTVPYIGAAVNGTKSFWRIFSVDPVGVFSRFVGGFVVPIMAFTGMALADPEARKKYEQLSEYEKDNNIIVNVDGSLMKIPIPQEIGPLVKPWQHLVEKMWNSNRHDFWELMLNDALGISPMDITGFYDLDQDAMEDPTIWDRLENGATQLFFGQMAPIPIKAGYMLTTGKDPYTGKFIDTSYQYYDSESGEVVPMDSSQSAFAQVMADVFGGPASVIAAVTTSLFGRTGMDVLDALTSIGQYVSTGGEKGDWATILQRAGESVVKPITVADYDRTKTAWNREVSALYRGKESILNSEKYKKIEQKINQETDPQNLKSLKAQRQDMLDPWYEKTKVAINKLQTNFGGTIDRYRMASLLSLLNMHENSGGIGVVGRAANDKLFYEGRDEAMRALIDMGASDTGDRSILGYMTKVKHNDGSESVEVKFNKPLEILAMQNAWYNRASVSVSYIKELLEDGPTDYTQEIKQVKNLRQQIYDKGALSQADRSNITALELEWNARVMSALTPYIERVTPESAVNDEEVLEYLDDLILIPSEFKKDKRGYTVTNKSLGSGSANDAYIKNYIRYIFGVNNTGYESGKNYSGRKTLGAE